jgi:hypothetical protein
MVVRQPADLDWFDGWIGPGQAAPPYGPGVDRGELVQEVTKYMGGFLPLSVYQNYHHPSPPFAPPANCATSVQRAIQ